MRITRTLAAALAISVAAIAAPVAQSQPYDTQTPVAQAQPSDMHASVAMAAAASRQPQNLRSADALDAAMCPRNNPAAAGASSQRPTALVAGVQPAAPASSTDDDRRANGLGGIVAGLFVIAGLAALYSRRGHRSQRLHASH
jgi:hypothetical protein